MAIAVVYQRSSFITACDHSIASVPGVRIMLCSLELISPVLLHEDPVTEGPGQLVL